MELFTSGKIYICREPVYWRLGIPGLTIYAESLLNLDIKNSGDWIIFMKRDRHALRALSYQADRALLFEQRLMDGKFAQVVAAGHAPELSRRQLQLLFSGASGKPKLKQLTLV